jgi:hypothetical protein
VMSRRWMSVRLIDAFQAFHQICGNLVKLIFFVTY